MPIRVGRIVHRCDIGTNRAQPKQVVNELSRRPIEYKNKTKRLHVELTTHARRISVALRKIATASTRGNECSSEIIANSISPAKLERTTVFAGVGETMTS